MGKIGANMIPLVNSHLFTSLLLYIIVLPFIGSLVVANEKSRGFFDYLNVSHIKNFNILVAKNLIYLTIGLFYLFITLIYTLALMILVKVNMVELIVSMLGYFLFLVLVNTVSYFSNLLSRRKTASVFLFYSIILVFYFLESSVYSIKHYPTEALMKQMSIFGAYFNFQLGLINLSSIILLLGSAGVFTYLCYLIMNVKLYKVKHD